jgi:hypothetical protein
MLSQILGTISKALGPVGLVVGIGSLLSGKKSIGEAARDAVIGSVAGNLFGMGGDFSALGGIFDSPAGQKVAETMKTSGLNPAKEAFRAKENMGRIKSMGTAGLGPQTIQQVVDQGPTILNTLTKNFKENPYQTLSGVLTLAGTVGALTEKRPEAPDMSDPSMLETNPDYRGFVQNSLYDPMTGTFYGPSATLDGPVVAANQGGFIQGPGTSTSDSINAGIFQNGRKVQEAKLSDGEFVMKTDAVEGLGNGDRAKGAARMYALQNQFSRMA